MAKAGEGGKEKTRTGALGHGGEERGESRIHFPEAARGEKTATRRKGGEVREKRLTLSQEREEPDF